MLVSVVVSTLLCYYVLQDGNKEAPAASVLELAASQESEDTLRHGSEHSSTSMSVRELASLSPTTDEVCVCMFVHACLCVCVCAHVYVCV